MQHATATSALSAAASFLLTLLAGAAPQGATPAAPPAPATPSAPSAPAAPAPGTRGAAPAPDVSQVPPLPGTPAPVTRVVAAVPFIVDTPWRTDWRAEHPEVTHGWLVVLTAPAGFLHPRQVADAVLYAGLTTAERLNHGTGSGHLVVVVPASERVPGPGRAAEAIPLESMRLWFGTPALPEQVTAADVAREDALAAAAGIGPRSAAELTDALRKGGAPIRVKDRQALLSAAAPLLARWAPDEAPAP